MGGDLARNPTDDDRPAANPAFFSVADVARLLGVPVGLVRNPRPAERGDGGKCLEGLSPVQEGDVGDMTAGLPVLAQRVGSAACQPLTVCSPAHLSMPRLKTRPVVPLQVGVIGRRAELVLIPSGQGRVRIVSPHELPAGAV